MSETTLWRFVTAALFTTAVAIGVMTASPVAVVITLVTWLSWLTMTDATREQVATLRRRTIVALARLRRRHDDELMELWCDVKGKPVAEYVPEGDWAPAEREQPDPITEPIEVAPPTVPDGMPLAVQSALIAAPSVDVPWEERRQQIEAEWRAAAEAIGGAA